MDSFEYIDNYFKGAALQEQQLKFEERLMTDNEFAENVAFYISTLQVARHQNEADKKKRFREIYYENKTELSGSPVRRLRPYVLSAAAVLAALFLGLYLYLQPAEPSKLAGKYISTHLGTMGVQMGDNSNPMQMAKDMYNNKDYPGALQKFEQVIKQDSSNYEARELAGTAALQMKDFDKALRYFKEVADNTELRVNTGKFYQALTLMTRNMPGDNEQSKVILQQVIKDDLYGKEDALIFLKKF
ncbi:MAG: tetratricopeptide repeat protein [Chitinophagaceae bacterium]